ncbi:lebercilin-like protein [Pituophis catenifer annectens]|uniref:lebercilin-like protein n=1 Tax=Pituophis catenifer annectens TaxID=94852 RepID=UPI003995B198
MASDHTALHHTVQEDKICGQCRKSGSSNDSLGWLSKSTNNSQDSRCGKSSSQSGSAWFNYSNDFLDNTSRTAVNGSKNTICSEENDCGISQNYYKDFHSDSFETSISEESGSYIIPSTQKPETKERNLTEKKKKNDVHTKGGKMLPKKKPQQKNHQKSSYITDHTINAQEKNNMTCRLLSARDHQIKELKNQVAVLQNRLETFITENKMLKHLQSQQLKAITKYENAEIKLPDLLATQANEVQTLRVLLRKSQEDERRASQKLRNVEAQLLKTTDALRALQKLCIDKKLEEREELQHKLRSLTQKLEARDKKTQDLEKQLSLNTASFRHQLAVEKKKTIEAQSMTANLHVEIESLKLKLKERERELSITNIYTHRMRKGQPEKANSCSSPKGPLINPKITCSRRPRNRQQGEITNFIEDSVTNYKPAFARFPKERQKDTSSTPGEENSHKIPPGKKRLRLEKLDPAGGDAVALANGQKAKVFGKGSVVIQCLKEKLSNILCVPEMEHNLLSVSSLDQKGDSNSLSDSVSVQGGETKREQEKESGEDDDSDMKQERVETQEQSMPRRALEALQSVNENAKKVAY